MLQLRRLGVDPAAAFNAAQAQQKGRRATGAAQGRGGARAPKQQKQTKQKQQQQATLTEQMSRLTTAGAPSAAGLAGTPPGNAGGSNPNSPSGQFGTLPAFMELEGADLDGLPVMSLSGDGVPGSPPPAQIKAEQARLARRQQQQQQQEALAQQQGGGGTVEGMPYMGAAAAAAGPPFGTTSSDMFLSASALEGTLSDPQAFQGDAASETGMYSIPVSGGDVHGENGFAYTASSLQGDLGDMIGGLGSSAYGSHLSAGAVPNTLHSSDDTFAHLDLETSTAKLGGVADGL
jgi:hypothetical protein